MSRPARRRYGYAVAGLLAAIAITTAMDATGYSVFSALPLAPLLALFWYLERLPRRAVGFAWGRPADHGLALLYPLVVLGLTTLVALAAGQVGPAADHDWGKTSAEMALIAVTGIPMVAITEEGFFRGWLWASVERAGATPARTLVWTSLAFMLWHVSAVSLDTGFDLPAARIPIYLANAMLMGFIWGLLRWISGSVVVASVSHAVWNAFAYGLFGFGEKTGALGVEATAIFGPEVGLVGLALNLLFAAWLWRRRPGAAG